MKEKPDHQDAEIIIKLYDLRREHVMRESRQSINSKFMPRTWDDFIAVTKPDHPLNAAFRQTSTYWEMVFGMGRHGIVHGDYLVENNGEGMLLFAKVEPYLKRFREEMSPTSFRNAEWAATETEAGRRLFGMFQKRLQAAMQAKAPN